MKNIRTAAADRRFGLVLIIISAASFGVMPIFVRRSGPMASTTVIITSTAGVCVGIVAIHGITYPTTSTGWIAMIAIALISTVLAFVTFFAVLKRIGPTITSTRSTFEPIVAVVLAAIVLGETISPIQILGGILNIDCCSVAGNKRQMAR
jgi:drug/metabolite transporter (DMT)-like permease